MTVPLRSHLFTPVQIGPITLKHRVVMAPLTRSRSEQPGNIPGALMLEYYAQRASDGGFIVSEGTSVSMTARGWLGAPEPGARLRRALCRRTLGWQERDRVMRIGIHLPHIGRKAGPEAIRRAAIQAEELGFADAWTSEHIIIPKGAPYPPSALFYDPVLTLTWAAAFTKRIGLGTSVLVLPMRHPLPLAKELATLQNLSEGRLILGAGVGWMAAEFAALGAPFSERGRRMDEGIAMMLAVWGEDPVSFPSRHIPAVIEDMRMLPQPVKPIPIWIGGSSEAALARAMRLDGWHGSRLSPEEATPIVRRLREKRPEPGFMISLRCSWDGRDDGELGARLAAYGAAGVGHVLVEPAERAFDDWLRSVERAARAADL